MATQTAPKKPFEVTNTSARVIHTCGKSLVPGRLTAIDDQYVDKLKESPAFKARRIVEGKAQMPDPVIVPIEKLDIDKAKKLIAVETNVQILTAWAESDKRPEVLTAIEARAKTL